MEVVEAVCDQAIADIGGLKGEPWGLSQASIGTWQGGTGSSSRPAAVLPRH